MDGWREANGVGGDDDEGEMACARHFMRLSTKLRTCSVILSPGKAMQAFGDDFRVHFPGNGTKSTCSRDESSPGYYRHLPEGLVQ